MSTDAPVVIVTGGARGIGRAIAHTLARSGAHVVISDIDLNSAAKWGEELTAASVLEELEQVGGQPMAHQGDLRDAEVRSALVREVLAKYGRIDILVNNAGGAVTPMERSLATTTTLADDFEAEFQLNLMIAIFLCQEVVPHMRRRRSGSIVNMASRAALDPGRRDGRLTPYGMAKTGIVQYTRFLAHEVGADNVRVNCIAPGAIATARVMKTATDRGISTPSDLESIPLRRFGTPDDIAKTVQFFASDLSSYVTGQCLSVCGGTVLTPS